jgi:dipeptidyl aminopeptidase/acylaminoacyl peptidase
MKKVLVTLGLSIWLAGCSPAESPGEVDAQEDTSVSTGVTAAAVVPTPSVYSAREFHTNVSLRMPSSAGHAVSHDNQRVLISSDATGIYNTQAVSLANGETATLTASGDEVNYAVSFFPADDRILFTGDAGGNERFHLFVREDDGSTVDLTPGAEVRASFFGWDDSEDAFYLLSNGIDPKAMDLYRVDVDDYSKTLVYRNENALNLQFISSNGRWLAAVETKSNTDADVLLLDLDAEAVEPLQITDPEVAVRHSVFGFTPDNAALIYSSNETDEFIAAHRYDLASAAHTPYLQADWDVQFVLFSPSGRYQVWGVNEDARTRIQIDDLLEGVTVELTGIPEGDVSSVRFTRDEKRAVFMLSSDTAPRNLYVTDLNGAGTDVLSDTANPVIEETDLVATEVVRYPSYDGLEIPGILYRPLGADAENPVPAMVWVHGGPGGQSRTGFNPMIQHIVNNGYAVYAANNRGSSGYGKTFYHLDDKRHGEADLDDIVAAKSFLAGLDWVDGSRVGVIGGSYGGYMTVAALAFRPDVFKVGVDIFGVTNWVRTLESIPAWWETNRRSLYDELGDPALDKERLTRISPLFHAENISKPMLVIQGANDPRVLQIESDEIVETVRKNDVPVEYLVFPDEGHGFSKRENRIAASEAIVTFLDEYL